MNLEQQIHSAIEAGELRKAATLAVEGYGPEVLGFLVAMFRNQHDAAEVFSQACEDLWTGLPGFRGYSSFRTWFYVLARHAASRFGRAPGRRPGRRVGISQVSDIAEAVQSRTMPHLRTEMKNRFAAIRDELPEDDRVLLVLRVDRNMTWNEIALVLHPAEQSNEALAKASARLRKRFQFVKDEIRARARKAGLLSETDD